MPRYSLTFEITCTAIKTVEATTQAEAEEQAAVVVSSPSTEGIIWGQAKIPGWSIVWGQAKLMSVKG